MAWFFVYLQPYRRRPIPIRLPPMEYSDFFIKIGTKDASGYPVRFMSSLSGECSGLFVPPPPIMERWKLLSGLWRDIPAHKYPEMSSMETYGAELYNRLFQDDSKHLFQRSRETSAKEGRGLCIKIQIDPASLNPLQSLPWEALYDSSARQFLALSRYTPILRSWTITQPAKPATIGDKLDILLLLSSPLDHPPLQIEQECDNIVRGVADSPHIRTHILKHATVESLTNFLRHHQIHVVHFMGSATYHEDRGGTLIFEDEQGNTDFISGSALSEIIRDNPSLKLFFLNACDTSRVIGGKDPNPFRGVAETLVLSGVPAVLGMQFAISDRAAIAFSSVFYRRLAYGDPLQAALTEGRLAVTMTERNVEWVTPVLFTSNGAGPLLLARGPVGKQFPPSGAHLQIFLCHASEDKPQVRDLYRRLQMDGFDVWLDEVDLLGGTRWKDEIVRALRKSDVVLVCLSQYAITKRGFLQRELTIALDLLEEQPDGEIYIIPTRFEACQVPMRLEDLQYVDLFEEGGYEKLRRALLAKAQRKT